MVVVVVMVVEVMVAEVVVMMMVALKMVTWYNGNIRAVYTRENKQRIRQSAAYLSCKLSHLYDHGLYKKLVSHERAFRAVYMSSSRLTQAAYFPSYKPPYYVIRAVQMATAESVYKQFTQ